MKGHESYDIIELVRFDPGGGGGLAMGFKEELKPVLVTEVDDSAEIMTVEATVDDRNIRFTTAYGHQETDKEKNMIFF